jgi:hypothetical protein
MHKNENFLPVRVRTQIHIHARTHTHTHTNTHYGGCTIPIQLKSIDFIIRYNIVQGAIIVYMTL